MQSPVVLDKRSQDAPPEIPLEIPTAPSVPEPDQPATPGSVTPQPSNSFITYPDASTDETQPEDVQPVAPVEPAEPFTTYPSPGSDVTDDSSEPFRSWPDAQLPDIYPDNAAQINAVQPDLQTAPPETNIASPSPVELTQAEPMPSEQIQSETQVVEGETENGVAESDRPPLSAEQLAVLKPQAYPPSSELNIKPAL